MTSSLDPLAQDSPLLVVSADHTPNETDHGSSNATSLGRDRAWRARLMRGSVESNLIIATLIRPTPPSGESLIL